MDLSKLSDAELLALYSQNQPKPAEPTAPARTIGDRLSGAYRSFDAGVSAGAAGLGGALGDLSDLGAKGIEHASNFVSDKLGIPRYERPTQPGPIASALDQIPRSADVQKAIQDTYYDGKPAYEPKDIIERYLKTAGEFSVGGLGGPAAARSVLGKILTKVGRVAVPAVASETAGQAANSLTDDETGKYAEPVARFLAAVVGGGLHGYLTQPSTARAVLERNMPGVTPQHIAAADQLMQQSRTGNAVPLTWSEAFSQVRQQPTLTDLQRHLEASRDSAPQMANFFGDRPQQVERAVDSATQALSPGTVNPHSIGPRVADAAGQTIQDIRNSINIATRPLYDAAGQHLVPQPVHAAMMADPLFAQTVDTIRNDPARNAMVRAASDRSIAMYDAVAKELEQRSRNAAQPLNPEANQAVSAVTGAMGGDLKNVAIAAERNATQGPSAYEAALARQTQMRQQQLDPALQGPVGQVAQATSTPGAARALFPTGPDVVAGGQAQVGEAVRQLARRDPTAVSDLIRNHVETVFNDAASDLMSGPAQSGGAKFRQRILGNRQEARNLQAAVENATPDGPQRWQGFTRLMDILEATGTRLNVGSRTSYNDEIRQAMKSGGIPAKVGTDPLSFLKPLGEKYDNWKYGKNLKDLGTILTDPRAAPMLRSIAESNANSRAGARKAMTLLNYINATNAHQNEPTPLPPIDVERQ